MFSHGANMSSHVSEEGGGGNHSSHGLLSTIITVEADSLAHGLLTFTSVNPNCEHYNKQAPGLFRGGSNCVTYSNVSLMPLAIFWATLELWKHTLTKTLSYILYSVRKRVLGFFCIIAYTVAVKYSKILRIFFS